MHNESWDDLRFLLAVADAGSVNAAARKLGVNHATVLRRLAAFEARHGMMIFDRSAQGHRLRPGFEPVVAALRQIDGAVSAVDRLLAGRGARVRGAVRITSTDTFCTAVLPPVLAAIATREPDLEFELLCSNAHLDLSRMDAEIAVRPAPALPEGLSGEIAAELGFVAVEAASGGASDWLGYKGALAATVAGRWVTAYLDTTGGRPKMLGDSFLVLRDMASAGMGRTVIPACLAGPGSGLRRLDLLPAPLTVPIWVACHEDLSHVPRIRTVMRAVRKALRDRRDWLLTGDDAP
jgi:DNA-binding transcriptional LysR family regulator